MRFCSIFGTLTADRTADRYSLNSVLSQQPPPFPLRSVARIAAAIFSPSSGSTAARRTSSTAFSSSAVSGRFSGESRSPSRARSSYPCVLDSSPPDPPTDPSRCRGPATPPPGSHPAGRNLSLIHISEPTRLRRISYAVFCLKKKNNTNKKNNKHHSTKTKNTKTLPKHLPH